MTYFRVCWRTGSSEMCPSNLLRTSVAVTPESKKTFSRDFSPCNNVTRALLRLSIFARSSRHCLFAAPPTGGACTRILRRPSAIPRISLFDARGCNRTLSKQPSWQSVRAGKRLASFHSASAEEHAIKKREILCTSRFLNAVRYTSKLNLVKRKRLYCRDPFWQSSALN